MDVYYLVFVITLILSKILPSHNDREYLRKMIILFIPLFIYAALRVNFGNDYKTYVDEYLLLKKGADIDNTRHMEIGFQYLLQYSPSWRLVVIINSIVFCLSWIVLYYKNVANKYLSFALFLMFLAGNFTIFIPLATIRNGFTIGIMMLSFPLIVQRKYVYVLIIAYLGSLLHTSILMFLPLALIIGYTKELTKREAWIWAITLFVLFASSNSAVMDVFQPLILRYFGNYELVLNVMNSYMHDSILVNIANLMLFVCVILFFYKYRSSFSKAENSYFRLGLVYLFCSFLGALGSSRMQSYFLPFFLLILVKMFSVRWKDHHVLKMSFFLFVIVYYLYRFFYVWQWNNPYFAFEEYQSIFSLT